MKATFLILACLAAGFPALAGEERDSPVAAPVEKAAPARPETAATAGAEPLVTGRIPAVRIVVADSRHIEPEVEAESRVLKGPEMREIIEISRHKGNYLQLYLYRPPWRDPVLFQPGIYVPLETKAQRRKRQAAAVAAAEMESEAGETQAGETGRAPAENP